MNEADDTAESEAAATAWAERDEVLRFVEDVREDLGEETAPWRVYVQVPPTKAQQLQNELRKLPWGLEATVDPKREDIVCVAFDPRVVSRVAVLVIGHGGAYHGRS